LVAHRVNSSVEHNPHPPGAFNYMRVCNNVAIRVQYYPGRDALLLRYEVGCRLFLVIIVVGTTVAYHFDSHDRRRHFGDNILNGTT
jgi:hypothetical protein